MIERVKEIETMRSETRFRRQLVMVVAVLLGATLLLMGLAPREAQSQEEETAPAENAAQEDERLFDEDPKGNEVAAGELLVSYKKEASKRAVKEAPKGVGGQVEKNFPKIKVQLVSFPEIKNEQAREARQQALEQKKGDLERNPNVEAVDYNYVREGDWTPNDTSFGSQWGYPKIKAPQAWDLTKGSSSVKVAVIDSGINYVHPDLQGKAVAQKDFVNDDNDAMDDHGHGSHVSGTVAANTNNGTGVAGTCPNCSLLSAKVLNEYNKGTDGDTIAGIDWAVSKGAKVINMSLGGFPPSGALEKEINDAWNKGVVLVASSGNKGTNFSKHYPAAYENVIAVAATDSNDGRAIFGGEGYYYDPSTGKYVGASNAGDWVDVAAPGKGIYSTVNGWSYGYKSGTSMAAPHVSGLAGLLVSKGWNNSLARYRIEKNSDDLGTAGKDPVFGYGRINASTAFTIKIY